MRSVGAFIVVLAVLALPAAARADEDPCTTDAALASSLCQAGRPPGDAVAAATPTPMPTPAPAATAAPDRAAPRVSLRVRSARLARGLVLDVACSEACRTTVVATVDRTTARRYRLRSRIVGSAAGAGGRVTVKLAARLRRARTVRVRLTVTAVDAAGNRTTATRIVTVRS